MGKGGMGMVKRTVVLADSDGVYLKRLSDYFMEKAPQLELSIFTDLSMLKQYLQRGRVDILAVDETFADQELAAQSTVAVKIVLSTATDTVDGFETVKKYQKTESLLNDLLLKYAESTGSAEVIRGNSHTKITAFYSPAGGTGKSTLALGMATTCACAGLRTLYLNLEEIDSMDTVLAETPGTLSDLFLALKTKGMNVGIKLASSVRQEPSAGFYYVNGVESISEYGEMEGTDMVRLLETVKSQAEYDVMVLDLSSGFSERTVKILEQTDVIFVPVTAEETAAAKLNRLLNEAAFHENYNALFGKMELVANRMSGKTGETVLRESGLAGRLPCVGVIGNLPVLERKKALLQGKEQLMAVFQPLLARLMNG